MALSKGWPLKQLNMSNGFLHGDLQERVYLTQPPRFQDRAYPNYVCHLHKAFYSLMQAPQAWYLKYNFYIQHIGFQQYPYDASLFFYR